MPEPATVFVTNVSHNHDYGPVTRFGAMRPVTHGNYPIFKTQRLMEEIVATLVHSRDDDYLAFSGSNFVAALCLAVWLILHKECNALLFDKKQNSYVPRKVKRSDVVIQIEKLRDKMEAAG